MAEQHGEIFTVVFTMNHAEAKEMGREAAIASYLNQVANKVTQDILHSGKIMATDGFAIGTFALTGKRVTLKGDET